MNRAIVNGVIRREPSIDFMTADAAGLRGPGDPGVLVLAARTGRILVSHDVGTLPFHFRTFINVPGRHSPGAFLIPQSTDIAVAIDEILLIWLASEPWEWKDRLERLPF